MGLEILLSKVSCFASNVVLVVYDEICSSYVMFHVKIL
jgi:hypothetical protein